MSQLYKYEVGDRVQIPATEFPYGFPTKLGGVYLITSRTAKEPDGWLEPGGNYYTLDGHDDMLVSEKHIIRLVESGSSLKKVADVIEQHLQQAQARKKYKDIGRKHGTAKERRALDKVQGGNLADLEEDPETARKMVNKGKVWPEVNVQRERDMGSSSGCAYMKVKLHRTLAANPLNSKAARKIYVAALEKWQVDWDALRSYDDVYQWARVVMEHTSVLASMPEWTELPGAKESWRGGVSVYYDRFRLVFGKPFANLCNHASDAARDVWNEGIMCEAFTEEQEAEKRKDYLINWERVREYQDLLENITAATTTNELRMAVGDERWKGQKRVLQDIQNKGAWVRGVTSWLENAQKDRMPDKYRARQEDWSWAFNTKEKQETTPTGKPRINTYPFLSKIQRKNALEVTERENKVLTDKWGLKAVQYGNSLTDAESEKLTWHANMAFTDLRDLLGIDISVLNRYGTLGLDFATRGNAGASATYYSAYKVINLTKKWGDGALAHEWAHFFDNIMATSAASDQMSINGSMGGFASMGTANYPRLTSIVNQIMQHIRHGKGTETETRHFKAKNYRYYGHVVGVKHATIEEDVRYVYAKRPDMRANRYRDTVVEHLLHLRGIAEADVTVPILSSYQYYESEKIGTPYWIKKPELFARAFEGYVMHLMEQRGMKSDFLQASRKFYTGTYGVYPYPHKGDMDVLKPLFDELMETTKQVYDIPAYTAPANAPRISIEVENTSLEGEEKPSIDQKQQQAKKPESKPTSPFVLLARARAQRVRVLNLTL